MKKSLWQRLCSLLLCCVLLLSCTATAGAAELSDSSDIKVGDKITLGRYDGKAISWVCILIDDNGPLFLSENALCKKEYDAAGTDSYYHSDGWGWVRREWGSNCWSDSNIRQWLNASGTVEYTHCPPSYAEEDGFLTGFSDREKACIKTVTQKTNLNEWDAAHREGYLDGGQYESADKNTISELKNVIGTDYWYQNVTDQVFLLDEKQVYQGYNNLPDVISAIRYLTRISNNTGDSFEVLRCIVGNGEKLDWSRAYTSENIRPAIYVDCDTYNRNIAYPTYASTYGWALANNAESFGYEKGYRIPSERYYSVYGFNLSSVILSSARQITPWGGSCFGLSLLSLAQYYNIIDLKDYFPNKTDSNYLYDFGYNKIDRNEEGNEYFSIDGNFKALTIIEKAQTMQDSIELNQYRIFKDDSDYGDLIKFLSSDNARPILVSFISGTDGHTMVLTTDKKPHKIEGTEWYEIPAYDSNAPVYSSLLNNAIKYYLRGNSYLLVNPTTSEWKYYVNGKVHFSNKYYSPFYNAKWNMISNISGTSIWFYDISKLDSSIFNSTLNLWWKHIQLQFDIKNITIKNTNGEVLLKIKNGIIETIAENCICQPQIGYTSDGTSNTYTFYTNDEKLTIESDDANIIGISSKYALTSKLNKAYKTQFDFTDGIISAKGISDDDEISIAIQDFSTNRSIRAIGNSSKDKYVSLQITDENSNTVINTNSNDFEYTTDGIENKIINVETSICKHICHSENRFAKFIWRVIVFICKIFGINKTCKCGVKHF